MFNKDSRHWKQKSISLSNVGEGNAAILLLQQPAAEVVKGHLVDEV